MDGVAVRPEDDRFDRGGVARWRRTERSSASRQGSFSYLGVRVRADVQSPVYPVFSGTAT